MSNEFLINQILTGKIKCEVSGKIVYVNSFTPEVRLRASEVYEKTLRDARFFGLMSEFNMLDFLYKQGIWDNSQDTELKTSGIKIDGIKREMYSAYSRFSSKRVDQLRKALEKIIKKTEELYSKLHYYDMFTAEGIAKIFELEYLLENSVEENINVSPNFIKILTNSYINNKPSESSLRKIARSATWKNIWGASKTENKLFGKPSSYLSDEQRSILVWSRLYDNINDHPDCPDDKVIEDDDLLDGWLIIEHNKRKEEGKKKDSDNKGDSQEVFIVAETPEDAHRINQMNDTSANFVKRQRQTALQKVGAIREQDMPDSRQNVAVKAMQSFRDRMKGK